MSVVLGINAYHAGASAAIVVDGRIEYAIAEERLNRIKYFAGFPSRAIRSCLDFCGLDFSRVDYLAVGRDSAANRRKKLLYVLKHPLLVPNLLKIKSARGELDDLRSTISQACRVPIGDLRFRQVNVEHHLAHTSSAYLASGWRDAAAVTIDGSGDFLTCLFSDCRGRRVQPIHRICVPDSLGSLYTMICQFIGYTRYGDEGKVMGLAPLGQDAYRETFLEMIAYRDGKIVLNPRFFLPFGSNQGIEIDERGEMVVQRHHSDYMERLFGPPRLPDAPITQRDRDLAFGLQHRFEDIYFAILNDLHRRLPKPKLALAGGCVLNSVANGKIFQMTAFEQTFVQPAAGDEGLALGAALYVSRSMLGEGVLERMRHSYWGGSYGEDEIRAALSERGIRPECLSRERLIRETAEALSAGKIVGWFQGRSEWGPRALGNRSILCHPGLGGMKDLLNSRIKRRESFRPFAPAVLASRVGDLFEQDRPSPFMLHVFKTRQAWRKRLPAVNHVDDTGRLQTVSPRENRLFFDLINAFEEKTGIPALLNTSFNENEPIVETPQEAIDCFQRTRMDLLVIGAFVCQKAHRKRGRISQEQDVAGSAR